MAAPHQTATIPVWVNESHITEILQNNLEAFKCINKFKACLTGGPGENYQSVIVRVQITAELKDGSMKDVSFIIKTVPQMEQAAMMLAMMGHFPKENLMYSKYLPTFEKIFNEIGEEIRFGPKSYAFQENPDFEYVILDDLCFEGFKNENRIEGLDKEHTEAVLEKLAKFHAASAVEYEKSGGELMETILTKSAFNEQTAGMFAAMIKPSLDMFLKSLTKHEIGAKYEAKAKIIVDNLIEKFIELSNPNFDDFNVICHGDLWSNNIMFHHDPNGKIQETRFIDFQLSRYASPIIDLFYFLLTSPKLEIKVANFDDFIKFYHENLLKYLTALNYPKKLPSLNQLQMDFLKKNAWGFITLTTTCAGILLDPSECCNMEDFFKEGADAEQMKLQLYTNSKYVKHLEVILPWMDKRGLLDL